MHAQLGELKITERADKLTTVGILAGRPDLSSSADLTKAEATRVIDVLETAWRDGDRAKALDRALADAERAAEKAPRELVNTLKQKLIKLKISNVAEQLHILGQMADRTLRSSADLTTGEAQEAAELLGRAVQAGDIRALDQMLAERDEGPLMTAPTTHR